MFSNIAGTLLATNFFEKLNKDAEKSFEELTKYIENSDSLCEKIFLTSLLNEGMLCIVNMIIGIVANWNVSNILLGWFLTICATQGIGMVVWASKMISDNIKQNKEYTIEFILLILGGVLEIGTLGSLVTFFFNINMSYTIIIPTMIWVCGALVFPIIKIWKL